MANIKISDLPLIANITPSSGEFPIVYNNVTYKMNWSQLNNQITASGANPLNVTGTGTTGNITKWTTGGSVLGDSLIADNGSTITMSGNITIPNSGTIGSVSTNDAITILSGGQIGIKGTPSYDFHVFGSIISIQGPTASLRLIGTAGNAKLFDLKNDNGVFSIRDVNNGKDMYQTDPTSNGFHKWYINDSLKMILNSSGNVGIGTDSPSNLLHIQDGESGSSYSDSRVKLIIESSGEGYLNFQQPANSYGGIRFNRAGIANPVGFVEYWHNLNKMVVGVSNSSTDSLELWTNGTPKLTISSAGNVGIGATSASYKLRIVSDATVDNGIFLSAGSSSSNHILYVENQASSAEYFAVRGDGEIRLNASSGHTYAAQGIRLGANSTANNLNDYEEGTWTARLTTTGTAFNNELNQTGIYTKIGNLVTVQVQVLLSGASSGGTGEVIITGLPFTCSSSQAAYGSFNMGRVTLSNTLGSNISIPASTNYIRFLFLVNGANSATLDASALNGQSTPYISVTITYQV